MNKNTKLTFVNTSKGFCPDIIPLGMMYISSYLKTYGEFENIHFIDSNNQDIYGSPALN